MEVFEEKEAMRQWTRRQRKAGKTVALVPTMGFLHDGHLALVREAALLCDAVVVSIYVNPSQFGPNEDLDRYPRDLPGDLKKLEGFNVAAVFCPKDLYNRTKGPWGGPHQTWVTVEHLQKPLCGKGRPNHFQGVATVVTKLLTIVEPDVAVFGKKDFQQYRLICQLVSDLDLPVKIVGMPLVREHDGLALSSRNVRLSPEERQQALSISAALFSTQKRWQEARLAEGRGQPEGNSEDEVGRITRAAREKIETAGGRVEYVELVDAQTLEPLSDFSRPALLGVAAFFGSVRLIDNIELT